MLIGFLSNPIFGQKDPYEGLLEAIWLDSMTITAKKMGFDIDNFIDLVVTDTSFYQAFKNLRIIKHKANHHEEFFNEKGKLIDYYKATTQLEEADNCLMIKYLLKEKSGNYVKKNGDRKYLTATLYERVFLPQGKICFIETNKESNTKKEGIIDYYYGELKQFIFQPGEKANIPLIGNKTALFSEKMRKFYHYGISSKNYLDGTPCYVFTIKVKDEFQDKKSGKTVVKFMETYFSKRDFQVMGRKYEVVYSGLFFSFDINVSVDLKIIGENNYIPQRVSYEGNWDLPGRKKETGKFTMHIID
jgi:hypothetical protein